MRYIVFGSVAALFKFLWGTPGRKEAPAQEAKPSPAYELLMEAKRAWLSSDEPGGAERLDAVMNAMDAWLRKEYFYAPTFPPRAPFTPRQQIVLGYQRPSTPDFPSPDVWWWPCTMDVLPDDQVVSTLRQRIDADYGAGFFDSRIVSVRHVSAQELLRKEVTFDKAACDQSQEVV